MVVVDAGLAADVDEEGVVVAVLVVVEVVAVEVVLAAGAVVVVDVVDECPPFIILSILWQPPSVSIKAAAQTIAETRMVIAPVNSPGQRRRRTGIARATL